MLDELDAGWLEVCKVPGREGGYIRVAVSVNAEWYQRFCRRFLRGRRGYLKMRTIIKRGHTRAVLQRLIEDEPTAFQTVYAQRLLEFMEWWYD